MCGFHCSANTSLSELKSSSASKFWSRYLLSAWGNRWLTSCSISSEFCTQSFLVPVLHANLCSMKNYSVCRETSAQIHHKALKLGFKYLIVWAQPQPKGRVCRCQRWPVRSCTFCKNKKGRQWSFSPLEAKIMQQLWRNIYLKYIVTVGLSWTFYTILRI